jgi:hypothetical protein
MVDGLLKASGEAEFTTDSILLLMLIGKILGKFHPDAKALHVHAGKAMALKGVKAVVTGKTGRYKNPPWPPARRANASESATRFNRLQ